MLRCLPLVVTALAGCTFYISGQSGDAGGSGSGGIDADVPDIGDDVTPIDAPVDTLNPPLADAAIDSLLPPLDSLIPPLDGLVPPLDGLIPTFDAPVPPDAPPTSTVIETISVPCSGQTQTSQTVLLSSVTYRVRASGQCEVDSFLGGDILADAEYQGTIVPRDKDMGVDTGIAINDTTLGSTKFPHWGNYTATHVYEISGPGLNAPITLRYHDKANNAYGNNSGSLTIELITP